MRIAIIGGGTAGWLAASLIGSTLSRAKMAGTLSLIEAPDIPTIGVGEGTTSVFRDVLLSLGFDEEEFLRETRATIKYGIQHVGWRKDGGSYWGPIDNLAALSAVPKGASPFWLHQTLLADRQPTSDAHLFTHLMMQAKAPFALKTDNQLVPAGPYHHAYHFDQQLVGAFLSKRAKGVRHIRAKLLEVERHPDTGNVTHLQLEGRDPEPVDFVIDCSGFVQVVAGRMGAEWIKYDSWLPADRAMPFWLPHEASSEFLPYTRAVALKAGWMWQISKQDRIGCGYVFSGTHLSDQGAQSEIETFLGHSIEPRGIIPISAGRQRDVWIANTLSLGLAQSFLEPLEAKSIHGTLVQLLLFCTGHETARGNPMILTSQRQGYNAVVGQQVDDYAKFIHLHYMGGRIDSDFWCDTARLSVPETPGALMGRWQSRYPKPTDFPTLPMNLPHTDHTLYVHVLAGLGLIKPTAANTALRRTPGTRLAGRKQVQRGALTFEAAARAGLGHRAYLERLH